MEEKRLECLMMLQTVMLILVLVLASLVLVQFTV